MVFIKIMVIFFYKRKHHTNLSITQFLSCKFSKQKYYLHLTTSIKKKRSGAKQTELFSMFFHPSQAVKYVIKPGQNSLSAASLIIFFDFQDTPIAQDFGFNRNNTHVIVHFCFCLVRLYFFGKRKFSTTKRSHYISIIQPQAWCIFSLFPRALFFRMFNSLFY